MKISKDNYSQKPKCEICDGNMIQMIESNGKGVTTVLLVCYPCGISTYTGSTVKRGI